MNVNPDGARARREREQSRESERDATTLLTLFIPLLKGKS